jgi:hypothetical protein
MWADALGLITAPWLAGMSEKLYTVDGGIGSGRYYYLPMELPL